MAILRLSQVFHFLAGAAWSAAFGAQRAVDRDVLAGKT